MHSQVTLILRGDAADVMDVIQTALAADLIVSMTTETIPAYRQPSAVRRRSRESQWTPGQQVKVTGRNRNVYPSLPPVGTLGRIQVVHRNGLKSAVTVKWDGLPASRVGGRMIKGV